MVWLLYIIADAIMNWYIIEKRKTRPNYLALWIIRGIAAIAYGALILDVDRDIFWNWLAIVVLSFPFPFNFLLNKFRDKPLIYFGEESGIIEPLIVRRKWQDVYFVATIVMFLVAVIVWYQLLYGA